MVERAVRDNTRGENREERKKYGVKKIGRSDDEKKQRFEEDSENIPEKGERWKAVQIAAIVSINRVFPANHERMSFHQQKVPRWFKLDRNARVKAAKSQTSAHLSDKPRLVTQLKWGRLVDCRYLGAIDLARCGAQE
ncbi:hypothetical protein KM043_013741 [Ampulex compressa]|nr:hypothetical protein KM043_013741 [Ampulex compressa]